MPTRELFQLRPLLNQLNPPDELRQQIEDAYARRSRSGEQDEGTWLASRKSIADLGASHVEMFLIPTIPFPVFMTMPRLRIHGLWGLITAGSLVLGSYFGDSGTVESVGVSEGQDGSLKNSKRTVSKTRVQSGQRSSRTSNGQRPGRGSNESTLSRSSLADDPGTGLSEVGSLNKGEIQSLVRASIKSANPLERRRAFDRILQEIGSSGFSRELALVAREAMANFGATGDQWRLFDYAWGANHPDTAIAYLNEVLDQNHEGFLSNMIAGLGSDHPQRAIELFSSLDPDSQGRVRPSFLEGLVDHDAAVATDYLYDSTDRENYNWRPMDELARELVRDQGLESTLDWASDLPEGSLRGSAWSAAYAVWASQDPVAAVNSINEMTAGSDRNLAINGFVSAHAHQDGESTVTWAAEISEPGLRESALVRVGRQYYRQDPAAATQWFASSGLPQSVWSQVSDLGNR